MAETDRYGHTVMSVAEALRADWQRAAGALADRFRSGLDADRQRAAQVMAAPTPAPPADNGQYRPRALLTDLPLMDNPPGSIRPAPRPGRSAPTPERATSGTLWDRIVADIAENATRNPGNPWLEFAAGADRPGGSPPRRRNGPDTRTGGQRMTDFFRPVRAAAGSGVNTAVNAGEALLAVPTLFSAAANAVVGRPERADELLTNAGEWFRGEKAPSVGWGRTAAADMSTAAPARVPGAAPEWADAWTKGVKDDPRKSSASAPPQSRAAGTQPTAADMARVFGGLDPSIIVSLLESLRPAPVDPMDVAVSEALRLNFAAHEQGALTADQLRNELMNMVGAGMDPYMAAALARGRDD